MPLPFVRKALFIGLLGCAAVMPSLSFADYKENYIGEMGEHKAVYEDTLVHLARKYGLGFIEIRAANPDLDPWIPGAGAKIVLPTQHLLPVAPRKGVVINLPEMRIYVFGNGNETPKTFPIGIGREGLGTPVGKTTVVRKTVGPIWRPTDRMRREKPELPEVVYPGPDNPMGTHALYLGWPTYAIHGTDKPYGIGRRVSSGCIRLYPEGIIELYDMIPVGTTVNVVNQPLKVEWIDNELYLEAHPDLEQALIMEETGAVSQQKLSDKDMKLIIAKAGKYENLLNWPRIRTAVRERTGYPIKIAHVSAQDKKKTDKPEPEEQTAEAEESGKSFEVKKDGKLYTKVSSKSKIPLPSEKPKSIEH